MWEKKTVYGQLPKEKTNAEKEDRPRGRRRQRKK